MPRFETAQRTESYQKHGEDRVCVIDDGDRVVLVVADGAGGIGSGEVAAEAVIRGVENTYRDVRSAEDWVAALRRIDEQIDAGQSTAVVVDLRPDAIIGASVGDSQAWSIDAGSIENLTAHQVRKPLLGTGDARPTAFTADPLHGVLIVATDGLFNYAKRDQLMEMVGQTEFQKIPSKCVEMVRLPSGELWDDVGIIACRVTQ